MPTTATPPSIRIHSCSLVYLTSAMALAPVIAMRDEGQFHDFGGPRLAANDEVDLRAFARLRRDIAHGDRTADRRTVTAAGDDTEMRGISTDDGRLFARWRTAFGQDP